MAIAFSESSLSYTPHHNDKDTIGIGGIKAKFYSIDAPINSLLAIEQVWVSLLCRYNGDFRKALKAYKGTINNYKSYNITMALYNRIHKVQ